MKIIFDQQFLTVFEQRALHEALELASQVAMGNVSQVAMCIKTNLGERLALMRIHQAEKHLEAAEALLLEGRKHFQPQHISEVGITQLALTHYLNGSPENYEKCMRIVEMRKTNRL
jgi:hypothetical protein